MVTNLTCSLDWRQLILYVTRVDEETEALVTLVQTTRRPAMRLEAARQLAERRDPEVASVLLNLLETTSDPRVVPVVTVALSGLQTLGPPLAPLLYEILDSEADPRRPFMPLLLASSLGDAAVPTLIALLQDGNPEVAINAATQLGQLRATDAFEPLHALLADPKRPSSLRGVAASAIGALRDRRSLAVLSQLADTEDSELLAGVIDGLSDLRDPAGADYLEAILERHDLDEATNRAVRLGLLAMERYRPR